jgi:hypothetical protein
MPFSRRQGAYANTSGMVFGSSFMALPEPEPTPPLAPVPGYLQLIDAASGVVSSGAYPPLVSSLTPAGGTYAAPYTIAGSVYYEPGGFNGFPSIRGNGTTGVVESTTPAFAIEAMAAANTPFVAYISCQFLAATNEALFSFGNSASLNDFFEVIALTSGNLLAAVKTDGLGASKTVNGSTSNTLRGTLRVECAGATLRMEIDGVEIAAFSTDNFSTGALTLTHDAFFALKRSTVINVASARFNRRLWYKKVSETPEEKAQNYAYMLGGYTPAAGRCLLIAEGDSTTAPETLPGFDPWPQKMGLGSTTIVNVATGGHRLSSHVLPDQFADVNSNYAVGYAFEAASLMVGSNDYNNARTGAQVAADHATWAAASKAANPSRKLIASTTPLATTLTGSEDTERLAGNALLIANYAAYGFDALVRRDLIITNTATDTFDGVHATDAKNQEIADAAKAILQSWGFT